MYKFDDEFRPPGRVFMKATRESADKTLDTYSSQGSAITTSIDKKDVNFRHDVLHEKTIEAVIADYQNDDNAMYNDYNASSSRKALKQSTRDSDRSSSSELHQIVRNRNLSTEVVGRSMENSKLSQRSQDGHRRHVTHIVRKITTMSRAEERAQANNLVQFSNDKRTIDIGYSESRAIDGNKRVKVVIYDVPAYAGWEMCDKMCNNKRMT